MTKGEEGGSVSREERKEKVLGVLENSGLALPAVAIWRNQKVLGGTAERRTVATYLSELIDEGRVVKVDAERLSDGEVVTIDPGEEGYFMAASRASELSD